MSTEKVTPETLTFEHVKAWDGAEMKRHLASSPEMRAAIYKIAEERAAVAAQPVDQPIVETPPAEVVNVLVVPAEVPPATQPVVEAPKKIVVEYQATDEEGNPIGRPTHLEAATHEEMIAKMKEAHIQATRAFHRLKKQKVQSLKEVNNQPAAPADPAQMTDSELLQAVKELKSDDPQKALEAHRRLNAAETAKAKAEADRKLAEVNELRRQEQVSYKFLANHKNDFNNCEANVKLFTDYFKDNQLPWTLDNLEVAFHALESELAPVVVPTVSVQAPANPTPPAQTVTTPAAATVVQPAPTATVQVTPPANPAPAQPKPGVNGGIVPGQASAVRPVTTKPGLTMDIIHSWDGPTMRAKMRNPQLRAEIERVVAAAKIPRR